MAKYEIWTKGNSTLNEPPKLVGRASHKDPSIALKLVNTKINKLDNEYGSYFHTKRRVLDGDN